MSEKTISALSLHYRKPQDKSPAWPFRPTADPGMDFDSFMNQVASTGANADITVNSGEYATNPLRGAFVAAAWVAYANLGYSASDLQNIYGVTLGVPNYKAFSQTGQLRPPRTAGLSFTLCWKHRRIRDHCWC